MSNITFCISSTLDHLCVSCVIRMPLFLAADDCFGFCCCCRHSTEPVQCPRHFTNSDYYYCLISYHHENILCILSIRYPVLISADPSTKWNGKDWMPLCRSANTEWSVLTTHTFRDLCDVHAFSSLLMAFPHMVAAKAWSILSNVREKIVI